MARMLLRLLIIVTVVVLPLALGYAVFPAVAPALLSREAHALGVDTLEVRLERPGLRSLRINHLIAVRSGYVLDLSDVQLRWSLSSLRQRRLDRIDVAAASLTVDASGLGSGVDPGRGEIGSNPEQDLFSVLPVDAARVGSLSLVVPGLSFDARGTLDFEADRLSVRLEGLSPVEAEGLVLSLALSGSGGIDVALERAGDPAPPFLTIRSSLPRGRLEMSLDARLDGIALALVTALAGLPAGSGEVSGAGTLSLPWPLPAAPWPALTGSGTVRVDWTSSDGRFAASGLQGPVRVAGGAVSAALTGATAAHLGGMRVAFRPSDVRLVPAPLVIDARGELEVLTDGLQLAGAGSGSVSAGDVAAYALSGEVEGTLTRDGRRFPLHLRGDGSLDGASVSGRVEVTSGALKSFPVDVRHDTRKRRTEIRMDHPVTFSKPFLRRFWPGWQQDYDLDAGTVRVTADLVNDATGLSGSGRLAFERVAAHVGAAAIREVSGRMNVHFGEGEPAFESEDLRAALVDFGVPMREVEVAVSGTPAVLDVGAASVQLLGGRATAAPFSYRLADAAARTQVLLEDLDLSRILALEGEHITGTGRLDGTLPIQISTAGVSVLGGSIVARPPGGDIRLQSSIARAITQPGLDMALAALTNFRYTRLETAVDYSEQGDLALGVRLEGRNPDVERGRPIHFNLNVSENIPVLMRSLRLKDEFAERIERKAQR